MINRNQHCVEGEVIESEADCIIAANKVDVTFNSEHGSSHAPYGCFWHRIESDDDKIATNIGWKQDNVMDSNFPRVGIVCMAHDGTPWDSFFREIFLSCRESCLKTSPFCEETLKKIWFSSKN